MKEGSWIWFEDVVIIDPVLVEVDLVDNHQWDWDVGVEGDHRLVLERAVLERYPV